MITPHPTKHSALRTKHFATALALATFAAAALHAPAATLYWDTNGSAAGTGAAPTGNWNGTTSNWNTDSTGGAGGALQATTGSGDNLYFVAGPSASSGNTAYTVTLSGTQLANSLTFQSTGPATISGGTQITLGNGTAGQGGINVSQYAYGTTANSTTDTISTALALNNSQTWTANNTTELWTTNSNNGVTISGNISDAGSGSVLTIGAGTGLFILSGTNNFTGGLIVNGNLATKTAASIASALPITVNTGGTLDLCLSTVSNNLTLAGGTLNNFGTPFNGAQAPYSTAITGNITLTANSTINLGNNGNNNGNLTGTITGPGKTLCVNAYNATCTAYQIDASRLFWIIPASGTNNENLEVQQAFAVARSYSFANATVDAGSILALQGSSTLYTTAQTITLNGGTLTTQNSGPAQNQGSINVVVNAPSAIAQYAGTNQWNNNDFPLINSLSGSANLTLDASADTGHNSLWKLELSGPSPTFSGNVLVTNQGYINGAKVQIDNPNSLGSGQVCIQPNAQLYVNTSGYTNSTMVQGGTLRLTAAMANANNAYLDSGPTSLSTLSLTANIAPALTTNSSGIVAIDTTGYTSITNESSLGNGAMMIGSISGGTIANTTAAGLLPQSGGTYRFGGGGGTLTISNGILIGANNLIVGQPIPNGGGTLKLAAPNTFSGGSITVNAGSTLEGAAQTSGSPFGSSSNNVSLNGGVLQLDVINSTTTTSLGTATFQAAGEINLNGSTGANVNTLSLASIARSNSGVLLVNYGSNGLNGGFAGNTLGGSSKVTVGDHAANPLLTSIAINGGSIVAPTVLSTYYSYGTYAQFVKYDATNGIVPVAATYTWNDGNTPVPAANDIMSVVQTGSGTLNLSSNVTVAGLILSGTNGASRNITATSGAGTAITITSGGLLFDGSSNNGNWVIGQNSTNSPTVSFNNTEAVIYAGGQYGGGSIYGPITNANNLTVVGPQTAGGTLGALQLHNTTASATSISGTITLNNAALKFGQATDLGGAGSVYLNNGQLLMNGVNNNASNYLNTNITVGPEGGTLGSAQSVFANNSTGITYGQTSGTISGSGVLTLAPQSGQSMVMYANNS